eukprot:2087775-Pleurochrysis_carterae.AAC.2
MSATCTLLSGSLFSFKHVSHVSGYAKESRLSPVARRSFKTNLRKWFSLLHASVNEFKPGLRVVRMGHSFYGEVCKFDGLAVSCKPAFIWRCPMVSRLECRGRTRLLLVA